MSLLQQPTMFNNQLNSFSPGHIRSRSYNELLNQFKASISKQNFKYHKKRSHSDLVNESSDPSFTNVPNKRSRTAPPSPPISVPKLSSRPLVSKYSSSLRARSLSPNKRFLRTSDSVNSSPMTSPIQTANQMNLKQEPHTQLASLPQQFLDPPYSELTNFQGSSETDKPSYSRKLSSENIPSYPRKHSYSQKQDYTQVRSTQTDYSQVRSTQTSDYSQVRSTQTDYSQLPISSNYSQAHNTDYSQVQTSSDYSQVQTPSDYSQAPTPTDYNSPLPIKLPSIASALNSANIEAPIKLKPIIPTVSLDYPDTYKPNDENWRYELLDSINKGSKNFNLSQYNYLNSHLTSQKSNVPSTSPQRYKPSFDSRISSKITKPTMIPNINQNYPLERKINFPYESNYTYLNKTYLNDVAKYPEYLELAQSLIQLSQPRADHKINDHTDRKSETEHTAQPNSPLNISSQTTNGHLTAVAPSVPFYSRPLSTSGVASAYKHSVLPPPSSTYHNYSTPTSYVVREPETQQFPAMSTIPIQRTHHRKTPPPPTPPAQNHKFIPISPPSSKSKSRSELLKSPPKHHHSTHNPRVCISCGSDQSPCWRPSWSIKEGQLCNSCGLRYKKTSARCLNKECKKIPAKGEWSLMQSKGKHSFEDGVEGYSCLECGWRVEVKKQ